MSKHTLMVNGREMGLITDGATNETLVALQPVRQRIIEAEDNWYGTADECADNGMDSLYLWRVADRCNLVIWCEQGHPVDASLGKKDLPQYVRTYLASDGLRESEALASYGFDGLAAETIAAEDYEGECAIWCEPTYYPGTCNAPQAGFVRESEDKVCVFATRAEAKAYVDKYYTAPSAYNGILECNVLEHGQAGADALTIVEWR